MGDVATPYDLEPLKEPLIESVINAYMAKNIDASGGLEFDYGSCKEGEFRFKAKRLPVAVEGGDFSSRWESFKEGVQAVEQQLHTAERGLATMCRNALADPRELPGLLLDHGQGPRR